MCLLAFHGEGILFSTLLHAFFVLAAVGALVYGLKRYPSFAGAYAALGYLLPALAVGAWLAGGGPTAGLLAAVLSSPWNLIVPCYNLDDACPLTPGVYLICALLNATAAYFLGARLWPEE